MTDDLRARLQAYGAGLPPEVRWPDIYRRYFAPAAFDALEAVLGECDLWDPQLSGESSVFVDCIRSAISQFFPEGNQ